MIKTNGLNVKEFKNLKFNLIIQVLEKKIYNRNFSKGAGIFIWVMGNEELGLGIRNWDWEIGNGGWYMVWIGILYNSIAIPEFNAMLHITVVRSF